MNDSICNRGGHIYSKEKIFLVSFQVQDVLVSSNTMASATPKELFPWELFYTVEFGLGIWLYPRIPYVLSIFTGHFEG